MKYMLDKNALTNDLMENIERRDDLCITQDVLEESGLSDAEITKMKRSGVQILQIAKKHLEKLGVVMSAHGGNLKLINLFTGKGTADVVMIAYVLAEREIPGTLFTEEYTIVTNDKELISVATIYVINCTPQIPDTKIVI